MTTAQDRRDDQVNDASGEVLGGALEHLRQVSKVWLPRMAEEYSSAAKSLKATHDNEPTKYFRHSAFNQASGSSALEHLLGTASIYGTGDIEMYPMWMKLRDILEAALGGTADTYAYTAQALAWATEAFADSDTTAADKLDDLTRELEDDGVDTNDERKGFFDDYKPSEPPEIDDPRDV